MKATQIRGEDDEEEGGNATEPSTSGRGEIQPHSFSELLETVQARLATSTLHPFHCIGGCGDTNCTFQHSYLVIARQDKRRLPCSAKHTFFSFGPPNA